MTKFDNVKNPKHYQGKYGLEAIDVMRNFVWNLKGVASSFWCNTIKYLLRFQHKNGLEDLRKAHENLGLLIEEMEKIENGNT